MISSGEWIKKKLHGDLNEEVKDTFRDTMWNKISLFSQKFKKKTDEGKNVKVCTSDGLTVWTWLKTTLWE